MVSLLRTATLVAALGAGSMWTVAQTAPPADAAVATKLVARPADPADRLRNQQQVVSPPAPPPATSASIPGDVAAQVIGLANAQRAAAGRAALVAHPALTAAALAHSRDQVAMGRMTHTGSDGSNAGTRIVRAGYTWRAWAENVAHGYPTAADVIGGWMGSPGHRANMLNPAFVHIGIAAVADANGRLYWTMVLAA